VVFTSGTDDYSLIADSEIEEMVVVKLRGQVGAPTPMSCVPDPNRSASASDTWNFGGRGNDPSDDLSVVALSIVVARPKTTCNDL
jgi:hypothetical protein